MRKSIKYAVNGAIGVGVFNAILNAIKQLNEIDDNPSQRFSWERLIIAGGKGAAIGGAGGLLLGSVKDYYNSKEIPLDTDAFLYNLINQVKLNKNDSIYIRLNQIADEIISLLRNEYFDRLSSMPMKVGSTEKGTALKTSFDIDICLTFKPNAFRSTLEMYNHLYSFLKTKIGLYTIIKLRKQKKSIGVYVSIGRTDYKIDVVPYKITKGSKTSGYLHVNKKGMLFDDSSYTKTDIHAIQKLRLNSTQQKIALLLKNWRNKNELPLSSHLLENLIIRAYAENYGNIPRTLSKKAVMVLRYISDNLNFATIRSIENTNNILTNLPNESKIQIIDACIRVVEEYEYQPNSIIESFG